MSDQPRLTRQWTLLSTLSSRRFGATVKELADELEVNLKTVRRDLVSLQEAGFPIEETVHERGVEALADRSGALAAAARLRL